MFELSVRTLVPAPKQDIFSVETADRWEITDSTLMLFKGEKVFRVFAPGAWHILYVEEIK